ncbi:pectate lyase-like protein [Phyllosticta citrichinensis]|uniref:Pectate lyase n=1 Tax=Phyllosticta citrichinensis TaxID=1130410 RepID=A0ABR1XFL8_9PEZI
MQYSIRSLAVAVAVMAAGSEAFMVPREVAPTLIARTPTSPTPTPAVTGAAVPAAGFPASSGTSQLDAPMTVTGSFDGGMKAFGRGVSCSGQSEGGDSDAVFDVQDGGTLQNVIIAADQIEGVHCQGACTIKNVWWVAVCEDALSIKKLDAGSTAYVIGGGAKGASDKVIQHNGAGTVSISGFLAEDFGKLYRSCGNCDTMYERHVIIDGVTATSGDILAGINPNFGDTATITNTCAKQVETICEEFQGTDDNSAEPSSSGSGPSASCKYAEADVAAC